MNVRGAVAGLLAGIIGAAAWAAVAYYANLEIGYLAWGVGFLVGLAVAAVGQTPGAGAGVVAVVITVAALIGGKYASNEMLLKKELHALTAETGELSAESFEDSDLIARIANGIAEQQEAEGQTIAWPEYDDDDESLTAQDTFPADIWQEASLQWNAKSAEEQQQFRQKSADEAQAMMAQFENAMLAQVRTEGFLSSFGAMDLLFFGLAIATAWGIANNGSIGDN